MKNRLFQLVIGLLAVLASCKKAEYPSSNDPVFSLKGSLDSQPFDVEGGVDDRYMLADFFTTTDGKLVYEANLGGVNTPTENRSEQFIIQFVQAEPTGDSNVVVSNTLRAQEFQFATSAIDSATLGLEYFAEQLGVAPFNQFSINIDGDSIASVKGVYTAINQKFAGPVFAELTDEVGQSSSQVLHVDLQKMQVSGVFIQRDGQVLTAHVFGGAAQNFDWSGGQSSDSTLVADSLFSGKKYAVSVSLVGGQIVSNSIDFSQSIDKPCQVRLNLAVVPVGNPTNPPVQNFENGRVIVKYISSGGEVFSSDFVAQPSASTFVVNSVEGFEVNEAGLPTKKLSVDFTCLLANGDRTAVKTLSNVKGVIAVGYPKE